MLLRFGSRLCYDALLLRTARQGTAAVGYSGNAPAAGYSSNAPAARQPSAAVGTEVNTTYLFNEQHDELRRTVNKVRDLFVYAYTDFTLTLK